MKKDFNFSALFKNIICELINDQPHSALSIVSDKYDFFDFEDVFDNYEKFVFSNEITIKDKYDVVINTLTLDRPTHKLRDDKIISESIKRVKKKW